MALLRAAQWVVKQKPGLYDMQDAGAEVKCRVRSAKVGKLAIIALGSDLR